PSLARGGRRAWGYRSGRATLRPAGPLWSSATSRRWSRRRGSPSVPGGSRISSRALREREVRIRPSPSRGRGNEKGSHAEVARLDRVIRPQRVGRAFVDDAATAQQIDAVGDAEGEGEVLLDEQDRGAPALQIAEHAAQLAHEER